MAQPMPPGGRSQLGCKPAASAGISAPSASPATKPRQQRRPAGNVRAKDEGINDRGWLLEFNEPEATIESPAFAVEARVAPWLRLNWWATDFGDANCYVEWTTKDNPQFSADRRVNFHPPTSHDIKTDPETRTMIQMYQHPGWKGVITSLRIGFANASPAKVVIKSLHTSRDTRITVNNPNFIRACHDYFMWSVDQAFLREQIPRIRLAMRFIEREFHTRKRKCIYTTWPGHEGRSGVRWVDGKKEVVARRRDRQQLLGPAPLRRRRCAGHDLLLRHAAQARRPRRADC